MAWRAAAAAQLLLGQLSLFPLRLWGADAQVGWDFQLYQPQEKVSATVGGTLTLTCTTSGTGPAGPLKWLKGWGSRNETIFDQTSSFPRVTRAQSESNTDFSIYIRDVRPEDAGTYYCVKFRKELGRGDELFQHGRGTEVSVHETALLPGMVAAVVVLCFLLLLSLLVAFCMYRRKRRGEGDSQCLTRDSFSSVPLRCCAGTPGTPRSKVLDAETSHLPSQQSSKEEHDIHYADLQPLPAAPRRSRSPGTVCSEYASVRVATK